MSISNSIRLTLNIKDKNIHFFENCVHEESIKNSLALVYHGVLTADAPHKCPLCASMNVNHTIIKHGSKTTMIKLPRVSNRTTFLKLRKQRYLCRFCARTFSLQTDLVKPKHSISENTFNASILGLKKKVSIKDLAQDYDISHTTLNNQLRKLHKDFVVPKNTLPPHLCFDEFKSVNSIAANMSFLFMDAVNGNLIDVVSNRQLTHLRSYFNTYSPTALKNVQTICIDMYSPYIELIKTCFPNAKIITDRFHVIQLLSRSLNATRVATMKEYPKQYRKLKRYWKLLLKKRSHLDVRNFRYFRCFPHMMSEQLVVDELLRIDDQLRETYWFYQNYLACFQSKDIEGCRRIVQHPSSNLSESMKRSVHSLIKHQVSIENALRYPYSNGVIEGTNNVIKVLKRIAFGYRSFENYRTRILLVANTLVRLQTI